MSLTLQHILVSERLEPATHASNNEVFFTVGHQVKFSILYPGRLFRNGTVNVRHSIQIEPPQTPSGQPPSGGGRRRSGRSCRWTFGFSIRMATSS
jgi:hypothetical protein